MINISFLKRQVVLLLIISGSIYCSAGYAQGNSAQRAIIKTSKMDWWREARFGMFIHWGVYAVPAGRYQGRHVDSLGEWLMHDVKIPRADYKKYAEQFNPVKYNAESWVLMAKQAGMKYIVITSKHHDGFALFDSKASDWNVVKATPYGKDLLKPLAEACRKYNMKLGFYYSQANDWYNPGGAAARGHWDPGQEGSMDEYIDKVAVPQVREILSNYGDVVELWWDVPTGMNKERADKLAALLPMQPGIITNDRLGGEHKGDITTPEQYIPATGINGRDWETCMTMNNTWGFKTDDNNWKSSAELIRNLVDIASKGGNYLLNVGPTAEGEFPQPIIERLKDIGDWMNVNGEAVYGSSASTFSRLPWGRCTKKTHENGTTFYFHVFNWPADGKLLVPGLKSKVKSAVLLAGGKTLTTTITPEGLIITQLPSSAPDAVASVIKVEISGPVTIEPYRIRQQADGSIVLKAEMADIRNAEGQASANVEGDWKARNIGYWTSPQSVVSWDIQILKPGIYTIKAIAGTPAGSSKFSISLGTQKTTIILKGTGDYNNYKETTLGTIKIETAGAYKLSVNPDAKGWQAINLREIRLQ